MIIVLDSLDFLLPLSPNVNGGVSFMCLHMAISRNGKGILVMQIL